MTNPATNDAQDITIDDLRDRLSGDRTAMLTTIDERGTLSSRPLTVQTYNDHGDVFFLVGRDDQWVGADGEAANASIVDEGVTWVSIAGRLRLSDDPKLLDELWDDASAEYFPDGKDDAIVAFVQSDRWEYWTAPTAAVQVFEFLKAKFSDEPVDLASSGTIET
ncbi:pyridoxamine 5'-phosphate oxidase family protein [Ilumatobacter nonamiensis]|uniref:pyridoxamine 5'-phosphate oxidase family protein n=1 Tax=Ilumatobacter nonamiensis TaxID=467093 RepID=UPI00130D6A78|nr:pyridoxamine 5'-phosphate oxidase family protein [Ilumatobacter nonamiensis]